MATYVTVGKLMRKSQTERNLACSLGRVVLSVVVCAFVCVWSAVYSFVGWAHMVQGWVKKIPPHDTVSLCAHLCAYLGAHSAAKVGREAARHGHTGCRRGVGQLGRSQGLG